MMSCVRIYGYLQSNPLYIYWKENFRIKVIQKMETLHSMLIALLHPPFGFGDD